jgi:hypothetical protein
LAVLVTVQLFVLGLYFPPVFRSPFCVPSFPPQTIISLPVQIAVCKYRAKGALAVVVGSQLSVPESYVPPVFDQSKFTIPPQIIILLPDQTAV